MSALGYYYCEENDRLIVERLTGMLHELPRGQCEVVEAAASFMQEVDLLRAAIALIDEPYPVEVFPDLQEQDAVFAAMRTVNRYATEQFHAMTARQRATAVHAFIESSRA